MHVKFYQAKNVLDTTTRVPSITERKEERGKKLRGMKSKYREGLLWEVVRIDGKGEGVIAKSDIAPGTLIVEDTPLFIVPADVHTKEAEDVRM